MFKCYNINPEHNDSSDCTVRAITLFVHEPYDDIYWDLSAEGFLQKRILIEDRVWNSYLEKRGFIFNRIPNDCPRCYSVREFAQQNQNGAFLLKVPDHVVCVIDGDYYDTWDSGNEVVLYYWRKEK